MRKIKSRKFPIRVSFLKRVASHLKIPKIKAREIFIFARNQDDGAIMHGNPNKPYVALTFDDGPNPVQTSKILDILRRYGVKATFFIVGKKARKYPELCRRIVEEGHDVGNHTYSHTNLVAKTRKQINSEIERAKAAIFDVTGVNPVFFRPPLAVYNNRLKRMVTEKGYKFVLWSVRTYDSHIFNLKGHRMILQNTRGKIKAGDIILLHDSKSRMKSFVDRSATVRALPFILDEINSRKLKPVKLSTLLKHAGKR